MNEENNIAPINEELNVVKYEIENIKNLIYTVRGKQVMLDSDVAMLYQCETRIINQAVKRNMDRFPERFCFKLTEHEVEDLKSQFEISSLTKENYGGRRILTSQNCNLTKLDINKFNKQYPILEVARTNKFHDRFIVIDHKELYHIGASLKDLGKNVLQFLKLKIWKM